MAPQPDTVEVCSTGDTFLCPACKGLVPEVRRAPHLSRWCPARQRSARCREGGSSSSLSEDSDGAEEKKGTSHSALALKALLSPQYEAERIVSLSCLPSGAPSFHFVQCPLPPSGHSEPFRTCSRSLVAPSGEVEHATGGSLWWSELVLAELLISRANQWSDVADRSPGVAISLGCGAAPVSAYVAAAMGMDVLCTDLPEVLPLARENVVSNSPALQALRAAIPTCAFGSDCDIVESRLDFAPLFFGESWPPETRAWLEAHQPRPTLASRSSDNIAGSDVTSAGTRSSSSSCKAPWLVLCSDCIWESHRHEPLARSIASLLSEAPVGSEALVAYQLRQGAEQAFFPVAERPPHNLCVTPLTDETIEAARRVRFPSQLSTARRGTDPAEHFCVRRLSRLN